jgi:aldehyde oxidoreductase
MNVSLRSIAFTVNNEEVSVNSPPSQRLAHVLREELGLTGTKIGCDAGDCGACTVLIDGEQICACMVPVAQAAGRSVTTVEGLRSDGKLSRLQQAFLQHGAAQCGICTPGMLMAAHDLMDRVPSPNEQQVQDALGGVLCRCTGYRKIIAAVLDACGQIDPSLLDKSTVDASPAAGSAVGAPIPRVDGIAKVAGTEIFGADHAPEEALWLRVIRSPHAKARFSIGDVSNLRDQFPGLVEILTGRDVPGSNAFGVYPVGKDQPVLAMDHVRYRGEAVIALVGDKWTIASIRDEDIPIVWTEEAPVTGTRAALKEGAALVQEDKAGNILTRGYVKKGDVASGFENSDHVTEGVWETSFVEHAYIEPEAGWARRVGDRIEVSVSTQAPYMDRDEVASVLGIEKSAVRIIPTACGGGFGGKLDVSVQPILAIAAWKLNRPVRWTYTRPESMSSSTKRHPALIHAKAGCTKDGRLQAYQFHGDFDTGAYASWGPTVADRVPVHATGPFLIPNVLATSSAVHTNGPPSGAFRGFGVPQSALANEALLDQLADACDIDRLEFRIINAIRLGDETATGQVLSASAGQVECLEALKPHWQAAHAEVAEFNKTSETVKRGVGIGCMWYGCGNTSMSNPSTMHVGVSKDGIVTMYNGAMDMGQGPNTIMIQICADALGIQSDQFELVWGDTDLTTDAGKSSASRQTFVSGKASQIAGEDLRQQILRLGNVGDGARIEISDGKITVRDGDATRQIDLSAMEANEKGDVLTGEGTFDPPTSPLDENGQGVPYATYGFGAHIASVEVDTELGTVRPLKIWAAHDVGRAINPTLLEGQIEGGIAQGLGLALMEEYIPGRTENLHDYLIPTIGDVPPIETILVEDPEPLGPFGAKGIGEQALIPTAPAIFAAIEHATGARLHFAPATPHRVREAILANKNMGS